jgi:hypothetical protein
VTVVGAFAPATTLVGLNEVTVGTGLFTVMRLALDVPPPGDGFTTVTASVPPAARSAEVSVADICVVLWKVVARPPPFTCTVVAGTKLAPVKVKVADPAPAKTLEGVTCASVGLRLLTTTSTAGPVEATDPLVATMDRVVPLASWLAGTTAVTSVLLMNVVASAVPPTWMTVEVVNPVPDTVRVVAELPAAMDAGVTDAVVNAAGCCESPAAPEPPQPIIQVISKPKDALESTGLRLFMGGPSLWEAPNPVQEISSNGSAIA